MTIQWTLSVFTISCLLIVFHDKSNTVSGVVLDHLKTVCMYGFPFDFNITKNDLPLKSLCSAMGMYSWLPSPTGLDLLKLKQGLPYVYFFDTHCTVLDVSGERVWSDSALNLGNMKEIIDGKQIDVLVFSFEEIDIADEIPPTVDSSILSLYKQLKEYKKDLLIGLTLPRMAPNALMNRLKDKLGDLNSLFVVETYNYQDCYYEHNQRDMTLPPTTENLNGTLSIYKDLRYPLPKIFFSIEVFVRSWKDRDQSDFEFWSYKWMCVAEPGDLRKYCLQTLDQIYTQVDFIHSNSLGGIFIDYADYDDTLDACHCGPFPALRVINGVVKGLPRNNSLMGCTTFARHR